LRARRFKGILAGFEGDEGVDQQQEGTIAALDWLSDAKLILCMTS